MSSSIVCLTIGHFSCGMPTCVIPREPPQSLEGILVCVCRKCTFSAEDIVSLPATHIFSRSRLRGTQGARLSTTVQVYVLAGLRGARSGRSKSEICQAIAGLFSDQLEPTTIIETEKNCHQLSFSSFFHFSLLLCFKYHSSCQRLDSRGTTAAN